MNRTDKDTLVDIIGKLKALAVSTKGKQPIKPPQIHDPFADHHEPSEPDWKINGAQMKLRGKFVKPPPTLPRREAGVSTPRGLACVCNRSSQQILCKVCGETFRGRVRLVCPRHPRCLYVMDVGCRGLCLL